MKLYILQASLSDEDSVVIGVYDSEYKMRLAADEYKKTHTFYLFYDVKTLNKFADWDNQQMGV